MEHCVAHVRVGAPQMEMKNCELVPDDAGIAGSVPSCCSGVRSYVIDGSSGGVKEHVMPGGGGGGGGGVVSCALTISTAFHNMVASAGSLGGTAHERWAGLALQLS